MSELAELQALIDALAREPLVSDDDKPVSRARTLRLIELLGERVSRARVAVMRETLFWRAG